MGSSGAKPRGHVDDAISVSAMHTTPRLTASDEPRPLQNTRCSTQYSFQLRALWCILIKNHCI